MELLWDLFEIGISPQCCAERSVLCCAERSVTTGIHRAIQRASAIMYVACTHKAAAWRTPGVFRAGTFSKSDFLCYMRWLCGDVLQNVAHLAPALSDVIEKRVGEVVSITGVANRSRTIISPRRVRCLRQTQSEGGRCSLSWMISRRWPLSVAGCEMASKCSLRPM